MIMEQKLETKEVKRKRDSLDSLFVGHASKHFRANQTYIKEYEPIPLKFDPELERPDLVPQNILKF